MERTGGVAWKVGGFVLLGLALVAVVVFSIRNPRLFQRGYELTLRIDSANGLSPGTPVKFAGVEVGEVRAVRIERSGEGAPVALTLWLPEGVELRADDRFSVGMLGVLGEKYVSILPGPRQAPPLEAGATVRGETPVSEVELVSRLSGVLAELDETLAAANALARDPTPLTALSEAVDRALDRAEALAGKLEQTADEARPLLQRLTEAADQASGTLADVRRWGPWALLGLGVWTFLVTR